MPVQVVLAAAKDCAADRLDERATVQTVFDGDTLRLTDGRVVRFIAINAPERARDGRPAEPQAEAASRAVEELLPPGSGVGLRFDAEREDRHGRALAHVFTPRGENVVANLLRRGLGFALVVAPNTWQQACYFAQEVQARRASIGVWGEAHYRPIPADQARDTLHGFVRIRGKVTRLGKSRHYIWLDLGSRVAIKVPLKHLHYFHESPIESYEGQTLVARGWVNFHKQKLRMTVSHPAMLEIVD